MTLIASLAVTKWRGLFEGDEWDSCRRKLDPNLPRFDEVFRWMGEHISRKPREATTPFGDDDHRVMVALIPGVAELWIYFRIEPDDNNCTLLWIESKGDRVIFRVG